MTSITWHYEFRNQEGTLCWTAEQVTVCTDMTEVKSKLPVPDWMREGLTNKMTPS
jgi:acyl-CoA thioesterase FadM